MGGVDAQLVRATRHRLKADARAARLRSDATPVRNAQLAVFLIHDLTWPIVDIESEWQTNRAASLCDFAFEQGYVVLLDPSLLELPGEVSLRFTL
jgi:hypothetical protein